MIEEQDNYYFHRESTKKLEGKFSDSEGNLLFYLKNERETLNGIIIKLLGIVTTIIIGAVFYL